MLESGQAPALGVLQRQYHGQTTNGRATLESGTFCRWQGDSGGFHLIASAVRKGSFSKTIGEFLAEEEGFEPPRPFQA